MGSGSIICGESERLRSESSSVSIIRGDSESEKNYSMV